MLDTIHDDTWNVLNMQYITQNLKKWDYSDIPGGGHKRIKGPAHVAEGDHHLRKAPNPHPHSFGMCNLYIAKLHWHLSDMDMVINW